MTAALPPLPSLRALTRELRELRDAWSHPDAGGAYVLLVCHYDPETLSHQWRARIADLGDPDAIQYGYEYIPGTRGCGVCGGRPQRRDASGVKYFHCAMCDGGHVPPNFDAVAAARRLLAAARDGGARG
jgi:hypothetical protein